MITQQQPISEARRWLKIFRADKKSKILDLSDPEPFPKLYNPDDEGQQTPKLALNYTRYDESFKSVVTHRHFIDVDTLDLLCWDMLTGKKGEEPGKPLFEEFKGGKARAAGVMELGEDGWVSRTLSVTWNDKDQQGSPLRTGPVYNIRFGMSEGEQGDKGQITPKFKGKSFLNEFISLDLKTARKLAKRVLGYIQAKESAAMVGQHYLDPMMQLLK